MFIVDQFHQCGTLFFVVVEVDRNAVLQIVHELDILLERGTALEIPQFIDRLGDGAFRQRRIDPAQRRQQFVGIERIGIIPHEVGRIEIIIPQRIPEYLNHRIFIVGFCIGHKDHFL